MKRAFGKKLICFVLGLCVSFTSVGVFADTAEPEERQNYIVITDVNPLLSPDNAAFYFDNEEEYKKQYRQALSEYNNSIKEEILSKRPSAMSLRSLNTVSEELSYTYTDLLSGFSISLTPSEAEDVKTMDGVSMVIKDEIICRAENVSFDEGMISDSAVRSDGFANLNAGNLVGAPEANDLGYTGKGRAIAVIDSYINPAHPYLSMSEDAVSNAKYTEEDIEKMIDEGTLAGVKSSLGVYRSAKVPFAYDYRYFSTDIKYKSTHGQHVSGIASGNVLNFTSAEDSGMVRGVAPDSQIIFMGIFSETGGASLSTLVAALDDAAKFEVDAINLSIGTPYMSEDHSLDKYTVLKDIVKTAANAGITVTYSGGNEGHEASYLSSVSDYSSSDNSLFPHVLKVGSVQGEYARLYYIEDDKGNIYPCESVGASRAFSALTDIVDCGYGTKSLIDGAAGKVAVIRKPDDALGALSTASLASYAASKGVAAVVLINNADQIISGTVTGQIPVLYVGKNRGLSLLENATKIKFSGSKKVQKIRTAPVASEFSSFGVSNSLYSSIDVAAPGGHIFSSVSTNSMANMSGTSMATPFVTGGVSLVKERVEKDFPLISSYDKQRLVRALITSTADTVYEENGALSSVRQVGSGLMRIDKALLSNAVILNKDGDLPIVKAPEFTGNEFTVDFKVRNYSSQEISFTDISADLSCDGFKFYTEIDDFGYFGRKTLSKTFTSPDNVTIPAGSETVVSVTFTLSESEMSECAQAMENGFFIDGKITLSGAKNNTDIGVAFTAFRGDWNSQEILSEEKILGSTYIFIMDKNGSYSYSFPEKTDEGYSFCITDDISSDVSDMYLVTTTDRNALMRVIGDASTGLVLGGGYVHKNTEAMISLYTLKTLGRADEFYIHCDLSTYDDVTEKNVQREYEKIYFDLTHESNPPIFTVAQSDGTVKVSAKDDTLVTTIMVTGKTSGGVYSKTIKELDKKEGTVEFNVAGLTDLEFTVYDKALNLSTLKSGIYFEKTKDKIYIKNGRDEAVSGTVCIAVYETDEETTVKNLSEIRKLADIKSLSEFEVKEIDAQDFFGKDFKIFFWDMGRNAYPLCVEYGR